MDFLSTLGFTLICIFIISGEINSTYPFVRLDDLNGRQDGIERTKAPSNLAMPNESGDPGEIYHINVNEFDGNLLPIFI